MSLRLCIETICVENRALKNLSYHEARLNKTRRQLWGSTDDWNLAEILKIPDFLDNSIHKCRLAYDENVDNIRWEPYRFREIKRIKRVYSDSIDYRYKYDDRTELNAMYAQRGNADEILIIKNGMVTDSQFCNVAFFDGKKWFTPTTCLLPGTQRALLLDKEIIQETEIAEEDIFQYKKVKLFNAMVDWERAAEVDVDWIM